MPLDEAPKPRVENVAEAEASREQLRKESLNHYAFLATPEDSSAYEHAAVAMRAFLRRGLDASDAVRKQLQQQQALPEGDKRKMSAAEHMQYEDMLTQVETWSITVPALLQQMRVVQFRPDMQERLQTVFSQIGKRDNLMKNLDRQRIAVMRGSAQNVDYPHLMPEFAELASIATVSWMLRQQLSTHPSLLRPEKEGELRDYVRAAEALPVAEKAYEQSTLQTGEQLKTARVRADAERKEEGAERITQNFPGAEYIAYTPESGMETWSKLFALAGPKDKPRYARQLKTSVEQFEKDFMEQEALKTFVTDISKEKDRVIKKNENVQEWFTFFFRTFGKIGGLGISDKPAQIMESIGDNIGRKLTTSPEEFEQAFQDVMKQMESGFARVGTPEQKQHILELKNMLTDVEAGKNVTPEQLRSHFEGYAGMQRSIADILVALQNWQVRENVKRFDGMGDANNLDMVMRIETEEGRKTPLQILRESAPYGIFLPRSYRDPSGRLILVELPPGPIDSDWKTNIREMGKIAGVIGAAPAAAVVESWVTRVPLLGYMLNRWYLKYPRVLGIPVATGEAVRMGVESGASMYIEKSAMARMDASVDRLTGKNTQTLLPPLAAKAEADLLFKDLVIVLHAAAKKHPTDTDPNLVLEAHVFVNQLLNGLGYPSMHELGASVMPKNAADAVSPELQDYIKVRQLDRGGQSKDVREQLDNLKMTIEGSSVNAEGQREAPRDEREKLLEEEAIPPGMRKEAVARLLIRTSTLPEFHASGGKMENVLSALGKTEEEQREAVFQIAGDTRDVLRELYQLEEKYEKREAIPQDKREEVEAEIKRLTALPVPTLLAVVRYFQLHEPTNEQIAQYWYKEELPTGFKSWFSRLPSHIDRQFGMPGRRNAIGDMFAKDWAVLHDYQRHFGDKKKN